MMNPLNRSFKKSESNIKYLKSIISEQGNMRSTYVGLSQT